MTSIWKLSIVLLVLLCVLGLSTPVSAIAGTADTSPTPGGLPPLSALPRPIPGEAPLTPTDLAALIKRGESGDAAAQLALARAYAYGIGVAKDEATAQNWLRRFMQDARKQVSEIPDLEQRAAALARIQRQNELALQLKEANRSSEALPLFRQLQAEAVQELGWGMNTTIAVTNNLATVLQDEGHYGEALTLYQAAVDAISALPPSGPDIGATRAKSLAAIHGNLGTVYGGIGNLGKALDHWQASINLRREYLGNSRLLAHSLLGKAIVLDRAGRAGEALRLKFEAKEMLERIGEIRADTYARSLGSLCFSLTNASRAVEATPMCEEAVEREEARAGDHSESLIALLANLADNRRALGDAKGELALRLRALGLAEAAGRPDDSWSANAGLARLLERQGNPEAAMLFAGRAVELAQQMRGSFGGTSRLADDFVASRSEAYRLLARLLIAQGRTAEALEILDLLRRSEADDFAERRSPPPVGSPIGSPEERESVARFIEAARELSVAELRAARLHRRANLALQDAAMQSEATAFDSRVAALRATVQAQIDRRRGTPRARGAATPSVIETVVPVGAMLLGYVIGDEGSYVYWSRGGPPQARAIPLTRMKLASLIAQLDPEITKRASDPVPTLRELHRWLIEPIADQLTAPLIVVAAVDDVRFVPFAALHDGRDFLVRRFAFQSLAGPAVGSPPATAKRITALGVSRASGDERALPGVVNELCSIVRGTVYGLPNPSDCARWAGAASRTLVGEGYLDAEFTEARLRSAARTNNVVHIATHFLLGQLDSQSFLVLADQRLGLNRLRDADFGGTPLLTLSACDTARVAGGSQFQGLASFMLDRGAGRVVATLWRSADRSTPLLMRAFYERIAEKPEQPVALALQAAQIALLDHLQDGSKPFAHPYYWAGFTVFEGRATK